MTFRVGQKVVCVDASPGCRDYYLGLVNRLVEGAVYTIRDIDHGDGVTGLRLEEIVDPILDIWIDRGPTEPVWRTSRFRPIVERKTDISVLKALLVPGSKIREDA